MNKKESEDCKERNEKLKKRIICGHDEKWKDGNYCSVCNQYPLEKKKK